MSSFLDRRKKILRVLLASTALMSVVSHSTAAMAQTAGDTSPGSFKTLDYLNSTGLDQIGAADAYAIIANGTGSAIDGFSIAGRQGGEGVTIAIIDDGADENHPDIAPNLVGNRHFNGSVDRDSRHGTAVAGIAAGAGNNGGIQGVAFNAGILNIQLTRQPSIFSGTLPLELAGDGAIAFDTAVIGGADIINLSAGLRVSGPLVINGRIAPPIRTLEDTPLETAMRRAATAGKLMVIAAGNSIPFLPPGASDIGADYPAQFANDPTIANGVIAVMAVDESNTRAWFSNSCLGVETRCLAAPGVNFEVAIPGGSTSSTGSSGEPINGTSFSAPLVSGAAAVVQAGFGVSPQEAGNRLLSTARDLGAAGTDLIYGRGLLDLENAFLPQGTLAVATAGSLDGTKLALADSRFSLGSSLALNGRGATLLSEAVALDDDNFPFAVDLGRSAQVRSRTTGLNAFIGNDRWKTSVIRTEAGAVTLALDEQAELDDPYRAEFAASDTALRQEAALPRVQMQSEVTDGIDLFFSFNASSLTEDGLVSSLPDGGGFFQPTAFLAPFDQLAGAQTGGGTSISLGERTALSVSSFASVENGSERQSTMQKLSLSHKTAADIELRLGYGFMQEEGGFLGSEAGGAFGASSGGNSQYLDLSLLAPVTETVSLFGAYTRGVTDPSAGGNSLLSNYSSLEAEAFGAGLVVKDLAKEGDGFSLMVGQPLRVSEGSADVTVPVGRTADGQLVREDGRLDLSPDGREIAIEAVYNVALDDENQSLSAGSFVRLNPDHDPNADPDVGFGLNYKIKF